MTEPSVSFAANLTDDPEPLRTVGIHRTTHSSRIPQASPSWFN